MKTVSNEIGRTKASITNLDILLMKVCNLFVIDKGEKQKKKIQLKPWVIVFQTPKKHHNSKCLMAAHDIHNEKEQTQGICFLKQINV